MRLFFAFCLFWASGPVQAERWEANLFGDIRNRYERVDTGGLAGADQLTVRLRTGLAISFADRFSILVEGEGTASIFGGASSAFAQPLALPALADFESLDLNRLQLTARITDRTLISVGRQRLSFLDERFVGRVAFRQDEQTFDAVSLVGRTGGLNWDIHYVDAVNRDFGVSGLPDRISANSVFAHTSVATPLGQLTGFGYRFDLAPFSADGSGPPFEAETVGFQLRGNAPYGDWTLGWTASYASQWQDMSERTERFNYALVETAASTDRLTLSARFEYLGGNATSALQTPLGTLHKFQGFADIFLTTPANGILDLSATASYTFAGNSQFRSLRPFVTGHIFRSARVGTALGREIDAGLTFNWGITKWSFVIARYQAEAFSSNTTRLFAGVEAKF